MCVDGPGTLTAIRTQPRKAAVWAKPTVSISAVCSAGLKKQENWPENTKNEPAEARSTMRLAGEGSSQSLLRFLETHETPVYVSCASLA